jgi:hypothetical protein
MREGLDEGFDAGVVWVDATNIIVTLLTNKLEKLPFYNGLHS